VSAFVQPTFWAVYNNTATTTKAGRLYIMVDNAADIYVNGVLQGSFGGFGDTPVLRAGVPVVLTRGSNVIALRCSNGGPAAGPAGVIASLYVDGSPVLRTTGNSWRYTLRE
jgi:hypothetical protein